MPAAPASSDPRPIGVFDSGAGGLTVARSLMDLLPDESVVYLADTARFPYGPKPLADVRRYAAEDVAWLAARDTKLVVAACNTATAAALEIDPLPLPLPVIGVIAPTVAAAVRATRNGRIGVIGTVGTVSSGAYERGVAALDPDLKLFSQACPRFVDLVESGRTTDPEVREVASTYLAPLVAAGVDTLILGCTHYPLLTGVLSYLMGPDVVLVSSAEATARAVFARLVDDSMLTRIDPRAARPLGGGVTRDLAAHHRFAATGDGPAFAHVAARFLGPRLSAVDVDGGQIL